MEAKSSRDVPGWKNAQVVFPCPATRAQIHREQIEQIDLVKRIVLVALALEDQQIAIGMEITFTAALAFVDELAGVVEKLLFRSRLLFSSEERCHEENQER